MGEIQVQFRSKDKLNISPEVRKKFSDKNREIKPHSWKKSNSVRNYLLFANKTGGIFWPASSPVHLNIGNSSFFRSYYF